MLSRSEENYLRVIAGLEKLKGYARVRDIAHELKVKSPTSTQMVQKLAAKGLVDYRPRDGIRLSHEGLAAAERVVLRYELFLRFFKLLKIPDKIAFKDACLLEHHLHAETILALRRFLESIERGRRPAETEEALAIIQGK